LQCRAENFTFYFSKKAPRRDPKKKDFLRVLKDFILVGEIIANVPAPKKTV
jgi:hypothetical protein